MNHADMLRPLVMALRSRLPSVSDRNVVELVALLQRRKTVVRLVLECWEWLVLREALPSFGLEGRNAAFQLKVRASTRLGDRFTVAAPWSGEGAQTVLAYVGHDARDIDEALTLEETPEAPALGRLLGYPDCCIEGYGEIVRGRPWVEKLVDVGERNGLSAYANKLGYLFRGSPSFLPDYYPCTLACEAAAALGRANYRGLCDFGLAALAETMKQKLLRPIVYLPGLLAQLPTARSVDGELVFDPATVAYYDSGFTDGRSLFTRGRLSRDASELDGHPCRVLTFVDDGGTVTR